MTDPVNNTQNTQHTSTVIPDIPDPFATQEEDVFNFKIGSKLSMSSIKAIFIQTLIIVAVAVAGFVNLQNAVNNQQIKTEELSKQIFELRNNVVTRQEAAVQFTYINDQNRRQDDDIRDLRRDVDRIQNR